MSPTNAAPDANSAALRDSPDIEMPNMRSAKITIR